MSAWFAQQIDFVFFLYGASFAILAMFAGFSSRDDASSARIPWIWLASFAAVHGVYEWIEMIRFSYPREPMNLIRLMLLGISFGILFEFGRRAIPLPAAFALLLPVLLIPAIGLAARAAYAESETALRLLIAAPASALAAAALWRAARKPDERAPGPLRMAAISFVVYGIVAGMIANPADWGLARAWNTEVWLERVGVPVQLIRTACAATLAVCIWRYSMIHATVWLGNTEKRCPHFRVTLIGLGGVLFASSVGAEYLGDAASSSIRRSMLERAAAIAGMLETEALSALRTAPPGGNHPVVRAVQEQLTRAQRAFSDIEQIYIYGLRGREIVFYACSESTMPETRMRPGEVYGGDRFPEDLAVFEHARSLTIGPSRHRGGRWVSAVVPVLMGGEGAPRAQLALGLDIAADAYTRTLRRWRLAALGVGALFVVSILDFFSRHHRLWSAAQRLAKAEQQQRLLSEDLERRVQIRTRELEAANASLQREMQVNRETDAKYRAITERVPAITYRVDLRPHPRTTYISPHLRDVLGYEPADWMADPEMWKRVLHPEDRDRVLAEVQRTDRTGEPLNIDFRMLAKNGSVRWIRNGSSYQRDEHGAPFCIHGVMLDITEQVEKDALLKESGERYRLLFKHSPAGLIHFDRSLRITEVNDRFAEMLDRNASDLIHADLNELAAPDVLDALKTAIAGGEGYHEGSGGFRSMVPEIFIGVRTAAVYGADKTVIGGVAIIQDLSDRQRIEEERMRTQKLESLGLLAGGIAHDFNNILTSVLGNISFARAAAPTGSDLRDPLEDAERAVLRARELTHQLLTFAKGGAPVKKPHDIAALVREAVGFTVHGSSSRCVYELAPDTWRAEVDAGQFTQVIQNLVLNADQAMPNGGVITIRTVNRKLVQGEISDLPAGPYVEIQVCDTGIGIPEHLQSRIFDPYFTTKTKGTGLGLTMCFSIMQKHGGHISVKSKPGEGSTFTLLLPALTATDSIEKTTEAHSRGPLEGNERILVMDDERQILALTRRILTRHGYTILTAQNGEQAIQIFDEERAAGRNIHLVILDVTVPGGMGGREALRHLRERDPDLPAIVSSGYAQDEALAQYKDAGFHGAVPKPYRVEELLSAIRAALDQAEGA